MINQIRRYREGLNRLLEGLQDRTRDKSLVYSYVTRHIQKRNIRKISPSEYSIRCFSKPLSGSEDMWHETDYGLNFYLGESLAFSPRCDLAFLGYSIDVSDKKELFVTVRQIQGVAKQKVDIGYPLRPGFEKLKCFNWEELLLRFIRDFCLEQKILITVLPAKKHQFYIRGETCLKYKLESIEEVEEKRSRIIRRLDTTAQNCGFEYKQEKELFVLVNPTE